MIALLALFLAAQDPRLPTCAEGWRLDLVARVPHPSVVCCSPEGRIFVGEDPIDMEGPIDRPVDRIVCLHPDGRRTVFAEKLGPVFGLMYLDGRLYVQHPPRFSVFRDDDGVGRDREDLLECTNPTPSAGNGLNDHIPANFRLGMDGWFYVAVGQKGIYGAGRDGRRFEMREGGVLRMRPDGTGLEVYARGTRNVMDLAMTSEDEIFGYDNDDHTKTWKVKLIHFVDGGTYGFPWDIKPPRPWILGPAKEFGSGAPTGAIAYTEDGLPPEYHDNLILCDWGRRSVTRLRVERHGATYRVRSMEDLLPPGPDDFRPVGIAIAPDGLGFYVTDWNFPGWKRNKPDVGRLFKLTWTGPSPAAPKPDWYLRSGGDPSSKQLIDGLSHPSRDVRMAAQRQLVDLDSAAALLKDPAASSIACRHALWAAASCDGARGALRSTDPSLRLQAARFLGLAADRLSAPMLASLLRDPDGAMRLRAAAALGRIGDPSTIPALLAALDDEDATVRHVVVSALQRIGAWSSVAAGLGSDRAAIRLGTLHALREAYDERVVERVAAAALDVSAPVEFRAAATAVVRDLERKPPPWDGRWWRNGPYAWCEDDPRTAPRIDRTIEWSGSPVAREALEKLRLDPSPSVRAAAEPVAPLIPAAPAPVPPLRIVSTLGPEAYVAFASDHRGEIDRGRACFLSVCIRCHRLGGRGGELGPDLAGVGSKYARSTLIDSVLFPSRQIAEGFQQTMVKTRDGDVVVGLARGETDDELAIADGEGRLHRIRKSTIEARKLSEVSLMPEGLQRAMTLQEFVDLLAFLESLQEADGFVPLFNGKDLGGWKKDPSHEAHWTVKEGGILRYDAKGKDLWTEKSYGDFVLKVDWRFPSTPVEKEAPVILPDGSVTTKTEKVMDGGDSGIFLRGSQKSQVNIWCWPIGSGEVYGYRTDSKLPPEIRAAATPKSRADLPPGQWNKFVITMKGDRLTVVLNGTTVIDQAQLPGVPARGPIGLQHPGRPLTPEMPVEFANLLIRELP